MTLHFAYWSLILRVITFLPLFWTQIVIYLHFLSLCIFTITVWKWNLVLPLLRHQHKNSVKEDKFTLANISLFSLNFVNIPLFVIIFQQHFNKNINNSCYNPSLRHSKWKKIQHCSTPAPIVSAATAARPVAHCPLRAWANALAQFCSNPFEKKKSIVPIQLDSNPRNRPN